MRRQAALLLLCVWCTVCCPAAAAAPSIGSTLSADIDAATGESEVGVDDEATLAGATEILEGSGDANDDFDDAQPPGCTSHTFSHTHVHTAPGNDGFFTTTSSTTVTTVTRCANDSPPEVRPGGYDPAVVDAQLEADGVVLHALFPEEFADQYHADARSEAQHCIDFIARGSSPAYAASYSQPHVLNSNPDGFTPEVRRHIAKVAEAVASATGGWTSGRHLNYPTPDLSISQHFPAAEERSIRGLIGRDVLPRMARLAGVEPGALTIRDAFVIKYDAAVEGGQVSLAEHVDGSTWSFSLLLNDPSEFEGGGTHFSASNITVSGSLATFVMHWGYLDHEGLHTTAGARVLLVGFVYHALDCTHPQHWMVSRSASAEEVEEMNSDTCIDPARVKGTAEDGATIVSRLRQGVEAATS